MTTHRKPTPDRDPNPILSVPSRRVGAAAPAVHGASRLSLGRFAAVAGGLAAR
jgi:hypothetical protein